MSRKDFSYLVVGKVYVENGVIVNYHEEKLRSKSFSTTNTLYSKQIHTQKDILGKCMIFFGFHCPADGIKYPLVCFGYVYLCNFPIIDFYIQTQSIEENFVYMAKG